MASNKLEQALQALDDAHSDDPNIVTIDQKQIPYELHYADKMTKYLTLHQPSASELLRLAVRAQHLRRWEIPRSSYPMNKMGYLSWRAALKKRHASLAEEICLDCGYSAEEAAKVAALVRKENMKTDEECQVLEDVACLVFLDDKFEEFEREHDEEKVIGILRKTWGKMSERGHELALNIPLSSKSKELIARALS
ncbi:conserved hypothetical protein [Uncinocarpus reesii 1704]|uniref:Glutamyl-tRNA synthetase n=1 Tax=Uncinocarpus reesii (strain UAMH 1704) TaxID=336963 RepID=C4JTQ1_UNCRE|nr:uncharacterized protein UREG_05840 [Uncinocarpus reesii 1704]EEP80998.1 conserved hypothetical protein [Uncinocarpus reesii 1704]